MKRPKIILAFSGGLDTTFCALCSRTNSVADVVTAPSTRADLQKEELRESRCAQGWARSAITSSTGGRGLRALHRAADLGNILRGRVYPLSVAAERVLQAELVAKLAVEQKPTAGLPLARRAGNDQIRFDGVFQALAPKPSAHTGAGLGLVADAGDEYLGQARPCGPAHFVLLGERRSLGRRSEAARLTNPWIEVPDSAFRERNGSLKRAASSCSGFARGHPGHSRR